MTLAYTLPLDDPRADLGTTGGKGASLARLSGAGLPVPGGFHITTGAYNHFVAENDLQPRIRATLEAVKVADPATLESASQAIYEAFVQAPIPVDIADAIRSAYTALCSNQQIPVAVRSSATAEDLPEASFAGQQDTYLNVCGIEAVLEAVVKCWASLWTGRAIAYRSKNVIDQNTVALAVVVQEMVNAEAAGILFTANPMNGKRDEMVINAAWGLGEAIVGGLVSPDTIVADKATGKVMQMEVADKTVLTVATTTGTQEKPLDEGRRKSQVLKEAQVSELVSLARRIEALYGQPQDIEWCYAEGHFHIVQSRPVTALPEPEIPAPSEWKLPKGGYAAMRNNIVELMADPLSPLFATLGLSAVNTSLHRTMNESGVMQGVMPDEIIIAVNQYAYYNGSLSPKSLFRVLAGAGRIAKWMFSGAVERWTETGRPRYVQTVEGWQALNWRAFSSVELVDSARQLTEAAIDAYGALVSGVIPAAWITEALFTTVYKRLIKRGGDPSAPTYLLGFDSLPIRADKSLYSLAEWARQHPSLVEYLERTPTSQLAAALGESVRPPDDLPPTIWHEWRQRFHEHLQKYGHTLYDLDFAHPVPVDDPTPVVETFKLYLRGQGANPHTRQKESEERREQAIRATTQRISGWRLNLFNKHLAPAQKYAPLREDGLAEIGLAYPLIRQMLLELGQRFAQHSVIPAAGDIFWLTQEEVLRSARQLDTGLPAESLGGVIPQRKAELRAAMRVSPPRALPQMKVFGFDLMSLKGRRRGDARGESIKGVACSAGRITGTARVLHGPDEFNQMKPGDVLVASITTPAWTPLFAMASAVVTDVGGPLSHGSIVAREYGIPAVLGTGVATRRIHSGDTITVDGAEGKVYLKARGGAAVAWKLPNPKGQYMRTSIIDLMPDPLSPLFATLGLDAIDRGIDRMSADLFNLPDHTMSGFLLTINGYAYYSGTFSGRQWWLMISRMVPAFPRLLRQGVPYWREVAYPPYKAAAERWSGQPLQELRASELLQGAHEVLDAFGHHLGALMASTMGPSAGSEMLFTRVYGKMVRREGEAEAPVFLMGFDSLPIQAEKALYDLAGWCRESDLLAAYLTQTPTDQVAAAWDRAGAPAEIPASVWDEWRRRFRKHLERYGYSIYDLDFARPLPMDEPAPILEALKLFIAGGGQRPHERQRAYVQRREQAEAAVRLRLKGFKRWAFEKTLKWAQSLAPLREDGIAEIGLGYPVLRALLRELGSRFAQAGVLQEAGDIYWLEGNEVEGITAVLESGGVPALKVEVVEERKALWAERKRLTPPPQLPPGKKYMGFDVESILAGGEGEAEGNRLKGVPTSPGSVTAIARVLHGPQDFNQMKAGDILVAGITTPAWTPLFALASAVVTDIGGPLSHGSIVAREYGIPAVMGTGAATRRIRSGQTITVDGGIGIVTIHPDTVRRGDPL